MGICMGWLGSRLRSGFRKVSCSQSGFREPPCELFGCLFRALGRVKPPTTLKPELVETRGWSFSSSQACARARFTARPFASPPGCATTSTQSSPEDQRLLAPGRRKTTSSPPLFLRSLHTRHGRPSSSSFVHATATVVSLLPPLCALWLDMF